VTTPMGESSESRLPTLTGMSHISLSVSDCKTSLEWYSEVLGFEVALAAQDEGPWVRSFCIHPSGLVVGFTQHSESSPFRFQNAGVDHLAFAVARREDLDDWANRFAAHAVVHSPIEEIEGGALLSFRDPDGIQLEMFYQRRVPA
jgi:glyoxylase I family protein